MEAPVLRWLYARRRPNQAFKIAFDQEIQRLYDEWDATGAKVAAGSATPFDASAYARAVGTAAGPLPATPHPLPYRTNPAEYFAAIRHAPGAVLLDSGRPVAERGRYDLLSAWPQVTLTVSPGESGADFLQRLRESLTQLGEASIPAGLELPFAGGLIGYLSYDFGRHLEQMPHLAADDLHLPDARFGLYAWALISDHQARTSQLVFHPALAVSERQRLIAVFSHGVVDGAATFKLLGPMAPDMTAEAYRQAIVRIQDYIQAGDCYQVNFAQRFRAPCLGDPWAAYWSTKQRLPRAGG